MVRGHWQGIQKLLRKQGYLKSGRRELNPRPLAPQATGAPANSLEIQGNPSLAVPTPNDFPTAPLPLAELLRQLAALPADQRAALAALLAPSSVAGDNRPSPPPPPAPAVPDDRCPLDTKGKG
jgi:hypothetical protein